jgi:hypothetical protein
MASHLTTGVIATRAQWAEQPPALLAHRRVKPATEVAAAAAVPSSHVRGSKRKASAERPARKVYEHETTEDGAASSDSPAAAAAASNATLLAPCFAVFSHVHHKKGAGPPAPDAAVAVDPDAMQIDSIPPAAAASTPAASAAAAAPFFSTSPIPSLSKRSRKALTQDYTQYIESLGGQALRVMVEALPRAVLRVHEMEEEYGEEMKREGDVTTTMQYTPTVREAKEKAEKKLGVLPTEQNRSERLQPASEDASLSKPLTSLLSHRPLVRSSYPALGSVSQQHGWTFHQPAKAHRVEETTRKWIARLNGECCDFITALQQLRTAFTLSMPQAGSANNLEVEIMEELLGEIKQHESWTAALRMRLASYHEQRAKLLTKCYKYPGAEDYAQAVAELEHYVRATMVMHFQTLRNGLLRIYVLFRRNEDKLQLMEGEGMKAFHSMI